jgi:hypothetical protein
MGVGMAKRDRTATALSEARRMLAKSQAHLAVLLRGDEEADGFRDRLAEWLEEHAPADADEADLDVLFESLTDPKSEHFDALIDWYAEPVELGPRPEQPRGSVRVVAFEPLPDPDQHGLQQHALLPDRVGDDGRFVKGFVQGVVPSGALKVTSLQDNWSGLSLPHESMPPPRTPERLDPSVK